MADFMGLMKQATQLKAKMEEMQAELERLGYRDVSHRMEFFGICAACAAPARGAVIVKKPKAVSPSARRP